MKLANSFIFDPATEKDITVKSRLVIYDNVKKDFAFTQVIEANEVSYDFLDSHFNYKYKYQVIEEEKDGKKQWVNSEKSYTRFVPEIVDDSGLKYLYFVSQQPSDKLIVCFQALQKKPVYNYIQVLTDIDAHRLYIKDGYGKHNLTNASVYLNENNLILVADLV